MAFFGYTKNSLIELSFTNFFRDKLRVFQNKLDKQFTKDISISGPENCCKIYRIFKTLWSFFGGVSSSEKAKSGWS